jgi:hypothetical protein
MSSIDLSLISTPELAAEIARRFSEAAEGNVEAVSGEAMGMVLAHSIRLLAERAQQGRTPCTFPGNNTISATEAVIACTAILESVELAVFELAAWQAVSNIGSSRLARTSPVTEPGQ